MFYIAIVFTSHILEMLLPDRDADYGLGEIKKDSKFMPKSNQALQ